MLVSMVGLPMGAPVGKSRADRSRRGSEGQEGKEGVRGYSVHRIKPGKVTHLRDSRGSP